MENLPRKLRLSGDPQIFEGAPFLGDYVWKGKEVGYTFETMNVPRNEMNKVLSNYSSSRQNLWELEGSGSFLVYFFQPKRQWIIGKQPNTGEGWIYAPVDDEAAGTAISPTDVPRGEWFYHDPDDRQWKKGGGLHIYALDVLPIKRTSNKRMRGEELKGTKEVDDYMSEAFLHNLEQRAEKESAVASTQQRKGEGWTWAADGEQRASKLRRFAAKREKLKDMMKRQLNDGFKEGMKLGRNGRGLQAPVQVTLHENRVGLGRESEDAKDCGSKEGRKLYAYRKKQAEKDLGALRRICEDFDRKNDVEVNELWGASEEAHGSSSRGYESDDDKEPCPTLQDFEAPEIMKNKHVPEGSGGHKNPLLRGVGEGSREGMTGGHGSMSLGSSGNNSRGGGDYHADSSGRGGNSVAGSSSSGVGGGGGSSSRSSTRLIGVREEIDINDNAARSLLQKADTHERIYEQTYVKASIIGTYVPPGHRGQRLKLVLEARSRMDIQAARNLINDIAGGTGAASRPMEETRELITELLTYLRSKYCYCYYCSITFKGQDDMNTNCPGPTEEDHAD
eukprot:jgi/Bigna1/133515/aug1.21_g8223